LHFRRRLRRNTKLMTPLLLLLLMLSFSQAPKTFLVFPLEPEVENPDLEWIGEGVALSIADGLRACGMTVMAREQRVQLVQGADLPAALPLSRASMIFLGQQSGADYLVMGSFSGTEADLSVGVQVLDLQAMKLGGRITGNGPISALPMIENDLSWLILKNYDLAGAYARADHLKKTRSVPNRAYRLYVTSLGLAGQDAAVPLLLRAVSEHASFPAAQFLLGRYYYREGNCDRALQHLSLAGTLNPEGRFLAGNCHLQQGKMNEAIRAYGDAGTVEGLNNLGVACLRSGDLASAERWLRSAGEKAPADGTVALNLAIARFLSGNLEEAKQVAEAALQHNPSHGMLRFVRSETLQQLGYPDEAAAALERSRRLGIEPEKLKKQDPKLWTRLFQSWKR